MKKDKTKKGGFRGFVSELPLAVKIFYILGGVAVVISIIYSFSERFADFFNRYVASFLRALLAYISGVVPFSVAEYFIILAPLIVVAIAVWAGRKFSSSWREVFKFCAAVGSVAALAFSAFVFGFGASYRTPTLDKKLGLECAEVSAEELYDTAMLVVQRVNGEAEDIYYRHDSFSVMPYTLEELEDKLNEAYSVAAGKYSFIQRLNSDIKPVMFSRVMSYAHITGVYTFATGEANLNVDFPDYTLPYTAAHELAHQRGIAREDEANFIAYLVSLESDDPYIRYSAELNLCEYLLNALWRADKELYRECSAELIPAVKGELRAYSEFFDKYRDSLASEVSGAVNDTYLTIQGTAGTASYGMVVDLAVAYYKLNK